MVGELARGGGRRTWTGESFELVFEFVDFVVKVGRSVVEWRERGSRTCWRGDRGVGVGRTDVVGGGRGEIGLVGHEGFSFTTLLLVFLCDEQQTNRSAKIFRHTILEHETTKGKMKLTPRLPLSRRDLPLDLLAFLLQRLQMIQPRHLHLFSKLDLLLVVDVLISSLHDPKLKERDLSWVRAREVVVERVGFAGGGLFVVVPDEEEESLGSLS